MKNSAIFLLFPLALAALGCGGGNGASAEITKGTGGATSATGGNSMGGASGGSPGTVAGTGGINAGADLGKACSTDADCSGGLTCHIDPDGVLGHRQCTKTCTDETACASLGDGATCLTSVNICVLSCMTDTDCPDKAHCNSAQWCERSGAGSGNAYCDGTPTPCSLLSAGTCSSSLGCSMKGDCGGFASSCYSQYSSYSCNAQEGCYWSTYSKSCSGSAWGCSLMNTSLSCAYQEGCYWSESCEGTPSSDCSARTVDTCADVPGCVAVPEVP